MLAALAKMRRGFDPVANRAPTGVRRGHWSGLRSNGSPVAPAVQDPFPIEGEPALSELLEDPIMDVVLNGDAGRREHLQSLIDDTRSRLREMAA